MRALLLQAALPGVAAALAPESSPARGAGEVLVQLDALLCLACLVSSGSTHDKLSLLFWTLDK
jgi:hypothetical protein